ncbi:hypothetical protein AB6735_02865 [Mucilaginibacter sp. RCC_168]|uniref:hypothetical protein n=1 Tax=Mucilaginibacter sp. RCC_168 TaxID=3239221 RepID=UPI003525087C
MQKDTPNKNNVLLNILGIGLITGTLDGLAALLLNYKIQPTIIFKFIASAAFGKAAFKGGAEMVVAGIVFHFLIAVLFTSAFYLLYPFFKKGLRNAYLIAVLYGFTAWIIMNLVVIPITQKAFPVIKLSVLITGIAILIVCLGLPIALIADRHLKQGKFKILSKK